MKKKIFIGVGVFVVLLGVFLAVVALNLNKIINSKKGELLAQAKKQTGREISIGDVGVTLWPGLAVRVGDLMIADDPSYSKDPFVQAKELRVSVKFMPLLHKRIEVKRLVLDEPNIVIIKGDATHFNFTSMVAAATPPAAGGVGGKPASNSSMAAVLAVADIENGTLRYSDHVTGMDRTIHDIDFTASNVGIGEKLDAKLDAAVFGDAHDVHVEASAGPLGDPSNKEALRATPLDVKVALATVKIADLMAAGAKPGQPAPQPVPGDLTADAEVSGTLGSAMLQSLNVSATVLGAKAPNLTLTASGGPFDFMADSTQVFANAALKGSLKTEPIALDGFKLKSTDPKMPPPVMGGDMRADASFEGNLTALSFSGTVDATNASFEQKDTFVKKPGIPAKADVHGTFRPQHTPNEGITLDKIDVTLHALTATGTGRVLPFPPSPGMEFNFDAKTPLKPWNDLLPAMAPFALSGDATVKLRVAGATTPGATPQISGTASFTHLGATLVDMPKLVSDGEGTATFTDKTAHIKGARFRIGDSRFVMDTDVASFTPMQATFKVTSDQVNRPDVQAPVPGAKPFPRPEVFRQVVATGSMKETAPRVVENTVTVTSQSGCVSNIDYTDLTAKLRVLPEITHIDSYSAKTMGGTVTGSGTFEPKTPRFDITSKVENVNLAEYFRYKYPELSNVLVGKLSGDIQLAGSGSQWEQLAKTLTGKGGAVVLEGSLLNMNIANQIMASIQSIPLVPTDLTSRMKARDPKLFSQNTTAFKNLSSKFTIANGKIQVPDLKLATSDFSLNGDGWFSLAKEMNVNSTLTISKKLASDLVAEVPAAKYLLSPDGSIDVPLALTGGVLKPAIKVDSSAMTAKFQKAMMTQGQQQLQDKMKSGLKDLLGGSKKPAPADTVKH